MKTIKKDKELEQLIIGLDLESPSADFTSKVMNKVYEETIDVRTTNEKIMGLQFWVFVGIFIALAVLLVILSNSGIDAGSGGLIDSIKEKSTGTGFQSAFEKMNALPTSIAGILLATSTLLFLDRFLTQKKIMKESF